MKRTITLFALLLLLTACNHHRSDSEVRKNLPGAWHVVPFTSEEDSGSKIIFTISPNGSFTRQGIFSNGLHSFDMAGTVQVQDGYLVETITNSSQRGARLPRVTREKIIRADDREIVFTIQGMTNQITIQKNTP